MSASAWFQHVQTVSPFAKSLYVSGTREAFLNTAEHLIERVVQLMEASRATYRKLDERDLSVLIVNLLGDLVPSAPEAHSNGHVDVTIWHPRNLGFRYITECKIWNGGSWHRKGMHQILNYSTGREGRAMCLSFFIRHKRMVFLLNRLRGQLEPASDPPSTGASTGHPFLAGAFVTPHEHSSGFELGIVHLGCYLWEEGSEDLGEDEE